SSRGTSNIIIANADGSNDRMLVTVTAPTVLQGSPAWSPDGKSIAMMQVLANGDLGSLVVIDADNGKITPIANSKTVGLVSDEAWLGDGSGLLIAYASQDTRWDRQIGFLSYPGGQLRRVTNDLNHYSDSFSAT